MLEHQLAARLRKGVEGERLAARDRRVNVAISYELRDEGQDFAPSLHPTLRISPVPLRRNRDTRKSVGFLGRHPPNLDPATQRRSRNLRPYFLHSREIVASTSTGTFSRISSPARTIAACVFSETSSA